MQRSENDMMYAKLNGRPERRRLGRWRAAWRDAFWAGMMGAILLVWYQAIVMMLAEGVI
jgi:hypothetical protein